MVFWCFATWLIPVLVAVGYWRHLRGVPFRFEPTWWSIVFRSACTPWPDVPFGRADDLPIVAWIGQAWMWVAVTAWIIAFGGMIGPTEDPAEVGRMTGRSPRDDAKARGPPRAHVPGYFAVVMGTGIITIGAGQRGWHTLAELLLILTAGEYAVLVLLSLWRVGGYRDLVVVDLKNPGVSFQFFTFVAGTNVLAAALAAHGHLTAATVLLCVGVVAVTVLGYVIPWLVLLARGPRSVLPDVNGTWFLWAVALHSVAIGAAISNTTRPRERTSSPRSR